MNSWGHLALRLKAVRRVDLYRQEQRLVAQWPLLFTKSLDAAGTRTQRQAQRRRRRILGGAASGLIMKKCVSPAWAASVRRRRFSAHTWCCQSSSAPQLPLRSTCSAAHITSAVRRPRSQSRDSGGIWIPAIARGVCAACGTRTAYKPLNGKRKLARPKGIAPDPQLRSLML